MKVLKSPRARRIFADLALQGQLSDFVASTTTVPSETGDELFQEFVVRGSGSGQEKKIKTRVINRSVEDALPA